MHKMDKVSKRYLSDPDRFADCYLSWETGNKSGKYTGEEFGKYFYGRG